MPAMPGPLQVDPTELRVTSDQIDARAADFSSAHQSAHTRAGAVRIGSGRGNAALPTLLAAWDTDATRFRRLFSEYAEGHRSAAAAYASTDEDSAADVGDAGSAM